MTNHKKVYLFIHSKALRKQEEQNFFFVMLTKLWSFLLQEADLDLKKTVLRNIFYILFCQGFRMESKLKDKIISKKIERFFKSLKSRLPPRFQKLVPNVSKMSVNLPDFLSRKLFMNKVTVTQFNIGNQY